jgi:hypothetical protein
VLIADAANGWRMLEAMSAAFAPDPPFIFVNDPMRDPPNRDVVAALPQEFREAITGMSPVMPPAPTEPVGAYATNALDCLNLIALATVEAGTDDPEEIAARMVDVSIGGALCNSFGLCSDIVDQDRTINYQGPNSIDLTPRGDPARGRIGAFVFDASGLDVPQGGVAISESTE